MDDLDRLEAKGLARAKSRSRRRRVATIRKRTIRGALALFALVWGIVFVQMISGNDPALKSAPTASAAKRDLKRESHRETESATETEEPVEPETEPLFESEAEPEPESEFEAEPEPEPESEFEEVPAEEAEPEPIEPVVTSAS